MLVLSAFVCLEPAGLAAPLAEAPRVATEAPVGEMLGVVSDSEDGIGIREVKVVLRRDGSRKEVSVERTRRGGRFTFHDLPQGVYSLEASAVGFLPRTVGPIVVKSGRETRVEHITLTPEPEGRSDS